MTFNRRALMRTAAWATPVALATTAVPAYAASPTCDSYDVFGSLLFDFSIRTDEVTGEELSRETRGTAELSIDNLYDGAAITTLVYTLPEGFTFEPTQLSTLPFTLTDEGRSITYTGGTISTPGDFWELALIVEDRYNDPAADNYVEPSTVPAPTLTVNNSCSGATMIDYSGGTGVRQ